MMRRPTLRGLDVIEGWKVLAEQRLAHLSELFETGRWRRYHTEAAFLENLREAKSVVETWRALVASEVLPIPLRGRHSSPHRVQGSELSEVPGRGLDISAVKQRYPLLFTVL
jgi:uncharacterized repeat protein (TIGR03809 family)